MLIVTVISRALIFMICNGSLVHYNLQHATKLRILQLQVKHNLPQIHELKHNFLKVSSSYSTNEIKKESIKINPYRFY